MFYLRPGDSSILSTPVSKAYHRARNPSHIAPYISMDVSSSHYGFWDLHLEQFRQMNILLRFINEFREVLFHDESSIHFRKQKTL